MCCDGGGTGSATDGPGPTPPATDPLATSTAPIPDPTTSTAPPILVPIPSVPPVLFPTTTTEPPVLVPMPSVPPVLFTTTTTEPIIRWAGPSQAVGFGQVEHPARVPSPEAPSFDNCVDANVEITQDDRGTLTIDDTNVAYSDGQNAARAFTISGKLADIQAALASLVYSPPDSTFETTEDTKVTLHIQIHDAETNETAEIDVDIRVEGANDPPAIAAPQDDPYDVPINEVFEILESDGTEVYSVTDADVNQDEEYDYLLGVAWVDCGEIDFRNDSGYHGAAAELLATHTEFDPSLIPADPGLEYSTGLGDPAPAVAWLARGSDDGDDDFNEAMSWIEFHAPATAGTCTLSMAVTDLGNNGMPGAAEVPAPGVAFDDSVEFSVTDPAAPADALDAVDDTGSTVKGGTTVIDVLANDTGTGIEVTGGPSDPPNGVASDNFDGTIVYFPDHGFTGSDSFSYEITDDNGASDTATVNVEVTAAPMPGGPDAVDDTASTTQATAVTIDVLANDTADGPFGVTDASDPANGETLPDIGGTITYTPAPGFTGTDTFTYDITDDTDTTDTATVTVTVTVDVTDPAGAVSADVMVASIGRGQTQTGHGYGFAPGEVVTGTQSSTPLDLGTAVTDANGVATFTWTIRGNEASGTHTLTVVGASGTASAPFDVVVQPGGQPGGTLPATGTDTTVLILLSAVLVIGSGVISAFVRRGAPDRDGQR